ncbi:peptidase [Rhodanobacter glycinis]|uniref:Peptidase n=2 Tax=Rhodanobacter glycinis TaxID=582702 RepID=A0A502BY97_9GAMM|nr:peptidase [Rhodanobacter glycinis]TPG45543.1 peptidase [Rhodanobacter glycinis]
MNPTRNAEMTMQRKTKTRIAALAGAGVLCGAGLALFGMPGHAQSGPPQKDMTVDKAIRAEVVDGIVASLDRAYVFPDKAAVMGKNLRAQLQHGDFDSLVSAEKFADTLTDALQRDSHDKHLEVRYFEDAIPLKADPAESPVDEAAELSESKRFNFGFNNVDRLPTDIGYVDMHQFGRKDQIATRIAATMTMMSDTKALIIDLRHCHGGDPEGVMLFASYLYDKPTHLNDVYWRDENRTEQRWTQASVAGTKYGEARKLYLLTSGDTFSGCEDFAYALKNNKRATLIGETTGGGAHAGGPHRLDAHFMMFVPSGRPINPVTHTDWEGVGVVPDVKTSAKNALDVAQLAILKDLLTAEADPVWQHKLKERIQELE